MRVVGISLAAMLSLAAACGDDATSTTINFGDGTATMSGGTETATTVTTSGVDTTDTASASGSSTAADTTSGDTETTGGEPLPTGRTMSQLVSAGTRSTSATYMLVSTFGQPSQLQSTHESASYRLRGGLAGANGSPP